MTGDNRFIRYYRSAALILVNTVLLFVLINLVLLAFYWVKDLVTGGDLVSAKYSMETLVPVYPSLSEAEISDLLTETWSRPYVYEPFTQFRERPYRGRYVNVDANGFRLTADQGAWPPDPSSYNIFLFGGSTAFGYGVADDQTIASHLQRFLRENVADDLRVYNFGRGDYYSTQERILFEQLLASGPVPDLAIFVDGLNDFFYHTDEPKYTRRLQESVAGKNLSPYRFSALPVSRVIRAVRKGLKSLRTTSGEPPDDVDPKVIRSVIDRYLANKQMVETVADSHDVKTVFVWQPIPSFEYDARLHPFAGSGYGDHRYAEPGYRYMAELVKLSDLGANFLWCADIQRDSKEGLYVDRVHYSARFSKQLAAHIAELMIAGDLLGIRREQLSGK